MYIGEVLLTNILRIHFYDSYVKLIGLVFPGGFGAK